MDAPNDVNSVTSLPPRALHPHLPAPLRLGVARGPDAEPPTRHPTKRIVGNHGPRCLLRGTKWRRLTSAEAPERGRRRSRPKRRLLGRRSTESRHRRRSRSCLGTTKRTETSRCRLACAKIKARSRAGLRRAKGRGCRRGSKAKGRCGTRRGSEAAKGRGTGRRASAESKGRRRAVVLLHGHPIVTSKGCLRFGGGGPKAECRRRRR